MNIVWSYVCRVRYVNIEKVSNVFLGDLDKALKQRRSKGEAIGEMVLLNAHILTPSIPTENYLIICHNCFYKTSIPLIKVSSLNCLHWIGLGVWLLIGIEKCDLSYP